VVIRGCRNHKSTVDLYNSRPGLSIFTWPIIPSYTQNALSGHPARLLYWYLWNKTRT